MTLRPVSELGLVDVTDTASSKTATTDTPQARTRQRRATKAVGRPDRTPDAVTAAKGRSLAVSIGAPALSGAAGLVGSLLLARAVLERGRG